MPKKKVTLNRKMKMIFFFLEITKSGELFQIDNIGAFAFFSRTLLSFL